MKIIVATTIVTSPTGSVKSDLGFQEFRKNSNLSNSKLNCRIFVLAASRNTFSFFLNPNYQVLVQKTQ